MSDATSPALRPRGVPSIVPLVNPIVRRLVGAGMPFGPNVLITIVGRSSGRPHTFPIALVKDQGRLYVQSPFGEVNWVRNLRASGEATVRKGRRDTTFRAVEVTPEEAGRILHATTSGYLRNPVGRRMIGWLFHLDSKATTEQFIAEGAQHPTFELIGE